MSDINDRRFVEILAARSVKWASSSAALQMVVLFVFTWILAGPFVKFSEAWQLTLVLSSAAITFLMVFLLLGVQMRDSQAMQLKLNEIIAALQGANNQLISIEDLSEEAIAELHMRYKRVATHLHGQDQAGVSTETLVAHEIAETQEAKE